MIPVRITLAGFMSYKEAQTLDFSSDSLWVIIGKNASGKTTIFDAIIFALFGKARVTGVTHADLINHHSDQAEIIFDFAVGSRFYRVKRTINKRGQGIRQAEELIPEGGGSLRPIAIPGTDKETGFNEWINRDIGMNFDVFTSPVLLRQGKADALLEAGTDTRYNILSQLIDLSKYEALAERARERKKFWTGKAEAHRQNLRQIAVVTDASLTQAKQTIEQDAAAAEISLKQVNRLAALLGQAGQWETLSRDLTTNTRLRDEALVLLGKEAEIQERYDRWNRLREALPALGVIKDLQARIEVGEDALCRLAEANTQSASPLATAAESEESLAREVNRLDTSFSKLLETIRQTSDRLRGVDPTIALLDQIDRARKERADYQHTLDQYPADLDVLLEYAQAEHARLVEVQQAAKSLGRLFTEQEGLSKVADSCQESSQKLAGYTTTHPRLKQAKQDAQEALTLAQQKENHSRTALAQMETRHEDACRNLEMLNSVSGDATCRYCGAPLTTNHLAKERISREVELEKLAGDHAAAHTSHEAALKELNAASDRLTAVTTALNELDINLQVIRQNLGSAETHLKEKMEALALTYCSLPSTYQVKVAPVVPQDLDGWLKIEFPTQADLVAIAVEVKVQPRQQVKVDQLARQQIQRNTTRELLAEKQKSLTQALNSLPNNWQEARSEHARLTGQIDEEDGRREVDSRALEEARRSLNIARQTVNALRQAQVRRQGEWETWNTTLAKDRKGLDNQIGQLPIDWQTEGRALTPDRLVALQAEQETLKNYPTLHQQLVSARKILSDLEERIRQGSQSIEALPIEARQPAQVVKEKLTSAQEVSRSSDQRLNISRGNLLRMEERRTEYTRVEKDLKDAERKGFLYGVLAEQFSERGIQQMLIHKAEVAIVALTNNLLDNLSGGRSKLCLRGAGGNRKALDLEVFDAQTGGDQPLLAGMASGSQRFRIAISLALAIGQYIGRESHRIESVIIDEGFGSLDAEGRESVIQELYNLRQHLKRILLVSHQEEFSKGFTTGYEIRIVNNASQVRLMAQR